MNKMEFDKKYVGKKLVVWCKTEELADRFLKLAREFGYKWCNGKKYSELTRWEEYEESTCYYIANGEYSYKVYFEENGFTVVEFKGEEIMKSKFQKCDKAKITCTGDFYTTYTRIFERAYKEGLIDFELIMRYDLGKHIPSGSTVTVLATTRHHSLMKNIVIVESSDGKVYAIDECGLDYAKVEICVDGKTYTVSKEDYEYIYTTLGIMPF